MSKVRIGAAALALGACLALPAAGAAAPAEPAEHVCPADHPAMLVRITGFKARTGMIRVQSYGGDPATYFDKGAYLDRVQVKVPVSVRIALGWTVTPAIAGASTPAGGRLTGSSCPPAMTTVPPMGMLSNRILANSSGRRTQPWLAG